MLARRASSSLSLALLARIARIAETAAKEKPRREDGAKSFQRATTSGASHAIAAQVGRHREAGGVEFASTRDGRTHIWLIGADGTGLRQLTDKAGGGEHLRWSPDGSRLVYASGREGLTHVYVADIATGRETRLTDADRKAGRRLLRCLSFYRGPNHKNPYYRPIEGVVALVDPKLKKAA